MTIEEKDVFLAHVINEHFLTQKNNPTAVPVEHLNAKGFDISDTRNALMRLKERGVITEIRHGWGFLEKAKGGKLIFVIRSAEDLNDDSGDVEAYVIKVAPARIAQMIDGNKPAGAKTLYLNKDFDLYREPKRDYCYKMDKKGIPLKILKYFANTQGDEYENTKMIASDLGMKSGQLRTEIGKLRTAVGERLGLGKNVQFIESRQGSGYRLNPKIEIVITS